MIRRVKTRSAFASGGDRVPLACAIVFAIVWTVVAIHPRYRDAWLLENLVMLVAVPVAVLTYRKYRISNGGYVLATIFLILHTIGSYYTYSEVPLGDMARQWFGLSRNHYDRFVHFSFGLLMLRPLRELTIRRPAALGRAATFFVGIALVSFGALAYEVVEWWTAVLSDPDAGQAFLGTQGDVWDSQWDMALAWAGATIAAAIHLFRQSRTPPPHPVRVRRRLVRVWAVRRV